MAVDPSTALPSTSAARQRPKRFAEGEGARQTASRRRVTDSAASVEQGGSSSGAAVPMALCDQAETSQLAAEAPPPAGALTEAAVAERAAKAFVVDTPAVRPSGMDVAADKPTNLLVHFVDKVVSGWPDEHIRALSRSFGNFDRVVARGWLVADALRPAALQLDRKQAYDLGFALQYRAKKIRKQMEKLLASGEDAAFLHAAVAPALILPDAAQATAGGERPHAELESAAPLWRLRAATKRATAGEAAAFAAWEAARVACDAADAAAEKRWAACKAAYDNVRATREALGAAGGQARVSGGEGGGSRYAHQMARVEQVARVARDAADAAAEKRWAACKAACANVRATREALGAAGGQARVSGGEGSGSRYARQMARVEQALEQAVARHTTAEEELERADARQSHASERCVAALEVTRKAREQQMAAEREAAHEAAHVESEAACAAQDAAYAAEDAAFNSALEHARQALDRAHLCDTASGSMQHSTRASACEAENSSLRYDL